MISFWKQHYCKHVASLCRELCEMNPKYWNLTKGRVQVLHTRNITIQAARINEVFYCSILQTQQSEIINSLMMTVSIWQHPGECLAWMKCELIFCLWRMLLSTGEHERRHSPLVGPLVECSQQCYLIWNCVTTCPMQTRFLIGSQNFAMQPKLINLFSLIHCRAP